MTKIFISYSRADEEFARQLAESLSKADFHVWLDVEAIPVGMNWGNAIQKGLLECELMLVIISPDSMVSHHVEDEWQYYLDKGKIIIPILWRPPAEIHFQLNRLQRISFHHQPYEKALEQLKKAIGTSTNPQSNRAVNDLSNALTQPQLNTEGYLRDGAVLQNRYSIIKVLSQGNSTTYLARDRRFVDVQRLVAIKEVRHTTGDIALHQNLLHQFNRQANILATLNHRGIPTIMDYFSENKRAYLVVQYIDGDDLESVLNRRTVFLPVDQVITWAKEVCEVLMYLHSLTPDPILLREFSPSSMIIDKQGHTWVVNYGVAKIFMPQQRGTQIGTEGYGAPEGYKGQALPATDIYGLGATLHHALTRTDPRLYPPFSFAERPITQINSAVPPALETIVMRALAFDHQDRFQSGEEMLMALQALSPAATLPPTVETTKTTPKNIEPQPHWVFEAEDEIRSMPLYHQQTIYVTSYDGKLYALSAEGLLQWKFYAEDAIATSPALSEDKTLLFFGARDYMLYAVYLLKGHIAWKFQNTAPIYSSPTVRHGHVFYGNDEGRLYAVRQNNGRLAFVYDAGDPIRSKPAVTAKNIIFGTESGEIHCLELGGTKKWVFRARRGVLATPLVDNDIVYIASMDGRLYACDVTNGFSIWRYDLKKPIVSSPCVGQQKIFIGGTNGILYALHPETGKSLWEFEARDQIVCTPYFYEDAVYFGALDGKLYCLDAKTGQARWQFQCEGKIIGSPLVINGHIYVGAGKRFYKLDA